jgi:hypothetical protein
MGFIKQIGSIGGGIAWAWTVFAVRKLKNAIQDTFKTN